MQIVTNIDDTNVVNEIIQYEIKNFREHTEIFKNINYTTIALIIFFTIICTVEYVFMIKVILKKVFFLPYKNIVLSNKYKTVSWAMASLFALANVILSFCSSWCILYFERFIIFEYKTLMYSLQIISFIVSWDLTYVLLNKFMAYYTKIRLKPL
ncbi:MAG: hypothetical protein IJ848_02720 [Alphaproteobacteria bacterium]|nr:hypothetical protein [Alphaproteobacteria bacterium]